MSRAAEIEVEESWQEWGGEVEENDRKSPREKLWGLRYGAIDLTPSRDFCFKSYTAFAAGVLTKFILHGRQANRGHYTTTCTICINVSRDFSLLMQPSVKILWQKAEAPRLAINTPPST